MAKANKIHWLTIVEVCVGTGIICWALMYPIDVILDWKETMDVRAYLPRAAIPLVVASVALFGAAIFYMAAKGVLSQGGVEKIITLTMVAFMAYGVLEFLTAGKSCPSDVINPAAAADTQTNDLASASNHE